MPKCSVIIPNYNHATYLKQRIDSVINQTYKDFEIIILDDCSTDNSVEIINSFINHENASQIIINEENTGSPFHQWAKGITLANGEWIWFAESDDFADPAFLETAFASISKCTDAGIFYSDSIYNSEDGAPYRFKNSASFKNDYFKTTKWSSDYCTKGIEELNQYLKFICTIINASCTLFRKDQLVKIVDNLNSFKYHGDWYCQIAIALNTNICYASEQLNTCRMHSQNFLNSTNKAKGKEEYFRILSLLVSHDLIKEKNQLIRFFTLQFIGFGILKDGLTHAKSIFRSYLSINRKLAYKVLYIIIWQKITFRKRKTIY